MKQPLYFSYEDEDRFSRIGTVDSADSPALQDRAIRRHIARFDLHAPRMVLNRVEREGVIEVTGLRQRETAKED